LAIAALIGAAPGLSEAKEWTTVRIAMDATYPPFEYVDPNGEIAGFDREIGELLCQRMNVTCTFANQAWDGIIPGLLGGQYDAIVSGMAITEERKKVVDFTDKYLNAPPAVVVRKESTLTGVSPDDLAGAVIGVQSSTTHANYVEQRLTESEMRAYPSPDSYELDLASGRIDAIIDSSIVLGEWVKSDSGSCCKILGIITPDPLIHGAGAGIAVRKEDQDLKKMFNTAIQEIRADGTYKTVNDRYFTVDVYGP
jgi:polar amino acid transport system substrate-binding protein